MKKDGHRKERAKSLMKSAGYKKGGAVHSDEKEDMSTIKKAVHKHEKHDHPGKPLTKLKSGGPVSGAAPKHRLDKKRRYASGGGVDGEDTKKSKKGSGKTQINIIVAGKEGQNASPASAPPAPMPMPPVRPNIPPAARPPMGGPPGGMVPPGAMRRGGAVKKANYPIDAGSGGGKGRLEKAAAASKHHHGGPKKRGGKC